MSLENSSPKNVKYIDGGVDVIYNISANDDVINVNTATGAIILYLPNIVGGGFDLFPKEFYINDVGGLAGTNNITVRATTGNTVNGSSQIVLSTNSISGVASQNGRTVWLMSLSNDTSGGSYTASNGILLSGLNFSLNIDGDGTVTNGVLSLSIASQSLTITNGGTTTLSCASKAINNFYTTSSATTTTIAYSSIADGSTVTIDYLKTTASNMAMTFPSGTIISESSTVVITGGGLVANFNSTTSGRFTISIVRINTAYKVFITQDIA